MRSCGIHLRTISQERLKISILDMSLKYTNSTQGYRWISQCFLTHLDTQTNSTHLEKEPNLITLHSIIILQSHYNTVHRLQNCHYRYPITCPPMQNRHQNILKQLCQYHGLCPGSLHHQFIGGHTIDCGINLPYGLQWATISPSGPISMSRVWRHNWKCKHMFQFYSK